MIFPLLFTQLWGQVTWESDPQIVKECPRHVLLSSLPWALSHLLVWVILLCPSVFSILCSVGTHRCCLSCPTFPLSSLLVFCVLPLPPSLSCSLSRDYTSFFCPSVSYTLLCSASSCSLFSLWEGCREEIYVGSTSGLLMCSSDSGVYVWEDRCQCVFSHAYVRVSICVCVCGCFHVEQWYGVASAIWASHEPPPPRCLKAA